MLNLRVFRYQSLPVSTRMKLVYFILFLGITPLFGQGTYQLRGRISGVRPNEKLLLKKQDIASARILVIDTIPCQSNGFVFRHTLPEVDIYTLMIDGVAGQVSFLFDHDIVLTGSRDSFKAVKITGSPLTEEWRRFERDVDLPFQEKLMSLFAQRRTAGRDTVAAALINGEIRRLRLEKTQAVNQRIRQRPGSLLSLYLLNWYWSDMPKTDALELYAGLATPIKTHSIAGKLRQQLGLMQDGRQN